MRADTFTGSDAQDTCSSLGFDANVAILMPGDVFPSLQANSFLPPGRVGMAFATFCSTASIPMCEGTLADARTEYSSLTINYITSEKQSKS